MRRDILFRAFQWRKVAGKYVTHITRTKGTVSLWTNYIIVRIVARKKLRGYNDYLKESQKNIYSMIKNLKYEYYFHEGYIIIYYPYIYNFFII